ncbi:MAG TPA: 5'/3'-nucleotidase SurE, partial [Balneola sp.]|nr:5'/3'-nucleotidase SurE [Balneola sp.]
MSSSKPLILVCNDDGIFSPGIKALAEVASEF